MEEHILGIDEELGQQIASRARVILGGKGIQLPEGQESRIIFEIMKTGLEQVILATRKMAVEQNAPATISIDQLVDVTISTGKGLGSEKDGNLMVSFTPGPLAKLLAKDDEMTEDFDD